MDTNHPQEQLYQALRKQLADLGVHDAQDLADRLKLELQPEAPELHPVQLLRMAHDLSREPLGGQDGFGDLTWRISCPRGLPHFAVEMEHDNESMTFATKLPFTNEKVERDFMAAEDGNGIVLDYIEQQDDEDRASIWEFIAEDCREYLECLHSAEKIRTHPRLNMLFLDAVAKGNDNAVQDGLDLGIDPNTADDRDQAALHLAARHGHTRLIAPLVDAGARINERCWGGFTPLHLAANYSHADTCLALINHQADTGLLDRFGRTALHLARGMTREQRQDL